MSWDILILNSEKPVDFENDQWPDFDVKENVISAIRKSFPESNWTDTSWGTITNEFADIEFNIGKESIGNNFMLHVRGGNNVVGLIFQMCKSNGWIAYDMSSEKFIDEELDTKGLENWKKYSAQVVSETKEKKPWWKF